LGLGSNALAALIRVAWRKWQVWHVRGARPETLSGLAVWAIWFSPAQAALSSNRFVGIELGTTLSPRDHEKHAHGLPGREYGRPFAGASPEHQIESNYGAKWNAILNAKVLPRTLFETSWKRPLSGE